MPGIAFSCVSTSSTFAKAMKDAPGPEDAVYHAARVAGTSNRSALLAPLATVLVAHSMSIFTY